VTAEGGTGDDKITVGGNTPDYVTVWGDVAGERPPIEVETISLPTVGGGTGADTIDVHADVSAWVNGQEGNDSINVQSDGSGIVYGDNGNDWIRVDTEGNQTVEGNYGNDTILGISDGSDNWIYGGEGNDAIAVAGSGSFSIVGGAGNDTISLGNDSVTGAYHLDVSDTVIFGNIDYDAVQVEDQNTQGLDAIKGFVFEDFSVSGDPLPKPQDLMDFTDFLVEWINPINMVVIPSNWTQGSTVNASPAGGNSIVVLSSTSTPSLSAMDFSVNLANTIQLNDNARAVVVVGTNGTSLGGGITEFDVYYVQDIDTGEGAGRQTWQVDKVADVTSATKVGVGSVLDNLLGGMTADPVVLVDNQLIDVQSNSDNFTIEWFDHELDGIQVLNFDANSGSVEDELDFFDGSDILQNVGNLSADVNVASGTVYLMEGEAVPTVGPNASDDVWTSGAAAGGQFVISDGDEAILIAGANQFSTSVNVFRLYDSDTTAVNVTAALTLIGTIDISSGSWITLSSDNFV
jgi:hypothetical protein